MVFSPSNYLRGLGWSGPGTSLQPDNIHARVKPITVAQKKTLAGVGKDRDTAYPWWEMVFASVAGKVGAAEKTDHHRTSTGIISPRPPPKSTMPSSSASSSASTPIVYPSSSGSGINMTALAEAKMEAARKQLYAGFRRGAAMGQTLDEEAEQEERTKRERKDWAIAREMAKEAEAAAAAAISTEATTPTKDERRAAKRRRTEEQERESKEDVAVEAKAKVGAVSVDIKKLNREKTGTKEERLAARLLRRRDSRDGSSSTSGSTSALATPVASDNEATSTSTKRSKKKKSTSAAALVNGSEGPSKSSSAVRIDAGDDDPMDEDMRSAVLAAKMERKMERKADRLRKSCVAAALRSKELVDDDDDGSDDNSAAKSEKKKRKLV